MSCWLGAAKHFLHLHFLVVCEVVLLAVVLLLLPQVVGVVGPLAVALPLLLLLVVLVAGPPAGALRLPLLLRLAVVRVGPLVEVLLVVDLRGLLAGLLRTPRQTCLSRRPLLVQYSALLRLLPFLPCKASGDQ